MMSPSGVTRTIPSPLPLTLLDPSTRRVHFEGGAPFMHSNSFSAWAVSLGVKSAMKSASAWDLTAVRDWYDTSYSLSYTVHCMSRPDSSGLCNIFLSGNEVITTIG